MKEKKILNLRGCIGTFILQKNIPRAIAKYTLYSAFRDSRFKPIEKSELEDLGLTVIGDFINAIKSIPDAPSVLYDGSSTSADNFLSRTLTIN